MTLTFFVPGQPKTAGSKRVYMVRRKGSDKQVPIVTDDVGKAGKDWRASVQHFAYEAFGAAPLLDEPLRLTVTFVLTRPLGHFTPQGLLSAKGRRSPFPAGKPDGVKLMRALEDALTKVLWADDACIVEHHHRKVWGKNPGAHVTIASMPVTAEAPCESTPPAEQAALW